MKMAVFWVVAPSCLVEVYRRFMGDCSLYHQDDEAAITSETSANFYEITRHNNTEDSYLHTRRRKDLKSHLDKDSYLHTRRRKDLKSHLDKDNNFK
jgi:hypothetical protein